MPPWLKEIEDHLEKAKQPLSVTGNFDDIKLEPGKIELTPDRFVVDIDRLLELAKRAVKMAEQIGFGLHEEIINAEDLAGMHKITVRRGQLAREFLEWVKEGK